MNIAVIGGDLRQCYLTETLVEAGYRIKAYESADNELSVSYGAKVCDTVEEALTDCEVIMLPVPVTGQWNYLADIIDENVVVFGWNIPAAYERYRTYDYKNIEEVARLNAIATAEGTLASAIMYGKVNVAGSKCLIVGYGRCGREIALLFRACGAHVTVAARSVEAGNDAKYHGMAACNMFKEKDYSEYDYVINTVPARVLDRREIDRLGRDVVIIDIASMPGGTDFAYCEEKGIDAVHCLGLPGKYSPKTSGRILGHAAVGIIETFNTDRK